MDNFRNKETNPDNLSVGAAKKLIKEAQMTKTWIVIGKIWFTPEEFEEHYPTKLLQNHTNKIAYYERDVRLQDPVSAIQIGKDYLSKQIELLSEFSIRVAKYYQGKKE